MPTPDLLLVEDDQILADVLAVLLRNRGFAVRHAPTGEAALTLAYQSPPDAVVLDILLPDLSGLELARRLRVALGERPVIVAFSVLDRALEVSAMLRAGCDAFVAKQVNSAEALDAVLGELLSLGPEQRARERGQLFEEERPG